MTTFTLITGATSGLGKEVAIELSKDNRLVLIGRDKKKLEEVLSRINGIHKILCLDFKKTKHIKEDLKKFLSEENIFINKVIHCAGVDYNLPVKSIDTESFDETMRVNFFSIVEILSVLLSYSVNKSKLENILFISSISSIKGFKAKGVYSVSKASLDAYMKVLSKELAPSICVNSILPGALPSPMSEVTFNDTKFVKNLEKESPLGIGSIDEVVKVIKFYHDHNLWVTGQQIIVDGGFSS